jgi:hypothetical protein
MGKRKLPEMAFNIVGGVDVIPGMKSIMGQMKSIMGQRNHQIHEPRSTWWGVPFFYIQPRGGQLCEINPCR